MTADRATGSAALPVCWEELTASDFPSALRKARGVCVLPIGVIEKHGPHLPLGTDVMAARAAAIAAAKQEYAVVFPWYYFGQIFEAKHQPGCIAIKADLLSALLESICDEIARNGFDKILVVNGHGGNNHWLGFFCQMQLAEPREYVVYVAQNSIDPEIAKLIGARRKTNWGGHADEMESSWMMALRPDLVKLERAGDENGRPRGNLKHLPDVQTGIWWYADFPQHYAGDARPANEELGKLALDGMARALARVLRAVKKDGVARKLQDEFHSQALAPLGRTPGRKAR